MVLFRYYLLGDDTAAPSGLFTRLCHAFLVSFRFISNFKKTERITTRTFTRLTGVIKNVLFVSTGCANKNNPLEKML